MTRPYFFFYATIIPSATSTRDSSTIYVCHNNRKRGPVAMAGRISVAFAVASLLKLLNAPNEQRLPTSLFINAEIKRDASEKKRLTPIHR